MMRVSVIIPALNEAERIGALVDKLRADGFDEIIVSDGASSDLTVEIARGRGARVLVGPACRGAQLHRGAMEASGDALWFLHADSNPPAGARAAIIEALRDGRVAAGAFRLAFDAGHPLLRLYGRLSGLNWLFTTFGDQGIFVRTSAYHERGGFAALPIFEDIDIQRRLRRAGRFVKLRGAVTTSARRFLRDGIMRRQALNAGLVALYAVGAPIELLARWYGR